MLEALCGNKNIEKILIFLFVNGNCYGAKLQRSFGTSLTPIQKALDRLEKGGLIMSYYEGKTRLYQFDPSYPLLQELEQLLKKTYTLLTSNEKKKFLKEDLKTASQREENKIQVLLSFWNTLSGVKDLEFHAKSKEKTGWNGKAEGTVKTIKESSSVLTFYEKGCWRGKLGEEVNFSNVFRWTLDSSAGVISLEHLRRGQQYPVFLFHLAPNGKNSLSSVDSHLCGKDTYFGKIRFNARSLRLNWRVIGSQKNEEINYHYF